MFLRPSLRRALFRGMLIAPICAGGACAVGEERVEQYRYTPGCDFTLVLPLEIFLGGWLWRNLIVHAWAVAHGRPGIPGADWIITPWGVALVLVFTLFVIHSAARSIGLARNGRVLLGDKGLAWRDWRGRIFNLDWDEIVEVALHPLAPASRAQITTREGEKLTMWIGGLADIQSVLYEIRKRAKLRVEERNWLNVPRWRRKDAPPAGKAQRK